MAIMLRPLRRSHALQLHGNLRVASGGTHLGLIEEMVAASGVLPPQAPDCFFYFLSTWIVRK
jgi:hypothetical protein